MKIDWTTDRAGMMLGFNYQDFSLIGLEWAQKHYIRLKLSTPDGINTVEFQDIDISRVQLWEGAIISDIFAWRVTAVPETVWDMGGEGAWPALLSDRAGQSGARSEAERIKKKNPFSFLVQVLTSCGGTIVAVCDKIDVSTEGPAR